MSTITLHIQLRDGTTKDLVVRELRPVGFLFEEVIKLADRPIYSLLKNRAPIPKRGVMIKDILKNGDTLVEDSEYTSVNRNIPLASYQNSMLREQVQSGKLPASEVMELLFEDRNYKRFKVLVRTNAQVQDLKVSLSEILRRPVGEIEFVHEKMRYILGWSGDVTTNDRVYDASTPLETYNLHDGNFIREVSLPMSPKNLQRKAEENARKKEEEERRQKEEEKRRKAAERERFYYFHGYYPEEEERRKAAEKAWQDQWRSAWREQERAYMGAQPPRSSGASAPPRAEAKPMTEAERKFQQCKERLLEKGIKNKKDFLRWAISNHPDKGGDTETFAIMSSCNDMMESQLGDKWTFEAKGGGRTQKIIKKHKRKGMKRRTAKN
jgi:hypothetical protein